MLVGGEMQMLVSGVKVKCFLQTSPTQPSHTHLLFADCHIIFGTECKYWLFLTKCCHFLGEQILFQFN